MSKVYCNRHWKTAGTVAAREPLFTIYTSAWIHALPLLKEGGLLDIKRLDLLFTPTLAVTPIAARGRGSEYLKV